MEENTIYPQESQRNTYAVQESPQNTVKFHPYSLEDPIWYSQFTTAGLRDTSVFPTSSSTLQLTRSVTGYPP